MRPCHYTITDRQVHQHAQDHLQHFLRLRDHGPKCRAAVLYTLLFWAARLALLATLPDFAQLQCRLNRALAGGLPKALRRRRQAVAIDLTLLPYYGKTPNGPQRLYRGARKAGTKQFFGSATAYLICKGCRWTLGLLAVSHDDPWDEIVQTLLRQVRKTGVKIRYVLLDRGFYSVAVIRYLQAARYPFIMPVIQRGRKVTDPRGPGGTRVFFVRKRSGWDEYVLQDKSGQRARVTVCVCCQNKPSRRRTSASGRSHYPKPKRQVWVYAMWGLQPSSISWVRETYRKRFGIESSYRQMNQGRIRTCTHSSLLRLLYVGVALVLRNVYVWLHWEVLAQKRRGYRRVDLNQLPLRAMLLWLQRMAEEILGLNTTRTSPRPMRE
jgi:putative transposase